MSQNIQLEKLTMNFEMHGLQNIAIMNMSQNVQLQVLAIMNNERANEQ